MPHTPTIETASDGRKYFDLPSNFRTARQNECIVGLNGQSEGVDISITTGGFFNISVVYLDTQGWHYDLNIQNRRQATNQEATVWKIPSTYANEFASHRFYFQDSAFGQAISTETADELQSIIITNPTSILAGDSSTVILQLKNSEGENLTDNGGVIGVTWSCSPTGPSITGTSLNNNGTISASITHYETGDYTVSSELIFS